MWPILGNFWKKWATFIPTSGFTGLGFQLPVTRLQPFSVTDQAVN